VTKAELGDDHESAELIGIIKMTRLSVGSKQEHDTLVLLNEEDKIYRLHLEGENPFEESWLRTLEGRRVSLKGTWLRGVVVLAKETDLSVLEHPSDRNGP
jgi:hypothetical protein